MVHGVNQSWALTYKYQSAQAIFKIVEAQLSP